MAYSLEALVAPRLVLLPHAGDFSSGKVVALLNDYALVPITTELFEEIWERRGGSDPDPYAEFWKLSPGLAQWAVEISQGGPVAYVEADFFSGSGTQAAIVWQEGELVFGPLKTFMELRAGRLRGPLLQDRAINQALQSMGIEAPLDQDEFDAIGLGRCDNTTQWSEADPAS